MKALEASMEPFRKSGSDSERIYGEYSGVSYFYYGSLNEADVAVVYAEGYPMFGVPIMSGYVCEWMIHEQIDVYLKNEVKYVLGIG